MISHTKIFSFLAIFIVAITTLLLSGCAHFLGPGPSRVSSADQAGSVRVAATTVSLWADVSTTMKPNFALTGDQAAAQVLPTTESIDQQVLTALGVGLAAGFPQTTASSSAGTTGSQQASSSTIGGVTTTTATTSDGSSLTTSKQTQSGTAPVLPTGTPAGATLLSAPGSPQALGIDPVLKYKAANNLFQEVQLLNQEIANAADRKCFVPYVIGLKVAFMNYRPHLAYSLHEHIGFFFRSRISNDKIDGSGDALFFQEPNPPAPSPQLAIACLQSNVVPEVVPLLVTDDIQVAVKARSAETATQIASALSFMTHRVGVGANLNAVKKSLESIQNHDLTSSLTVGRDTGSSIYVEVNANNTATGDPSLVNQTYDIPVLLLVPRSYFGGVDDVSPVQISVATYQQFRDAGTGKILAPRSNATFVQQGSDIVASYLQSPAEREAWGKLTDDEKESLIQPLYSAAASGTMLGLRKVLREFNKIGNVACIDPVSKESDVPCIAVVQAPSIWTALGTLGDDASRTNFVVQLPLPAPITVPTQQVLLSDDGENPIVAVVGGVGGRSITNLAALLRITPFDPKDGLGYEADVSAQSLALDPVAHTLTLGFPSLKKLGISCLAPKEGEPIPKAPPPAKGAKTSEASKCPPRASGPGSSARPNRIVLSLVGCDPRSQLCPELTPTVLPPDPKIAESIAVNLQKAEFLFDAAEENVRKRNEVSDTMQLALSRLELARNNARDPKSSKDFPELQTSLDKAIEELKKAQTTHLSLVEQQVSSTNVIGQISRPTIDSAAIGVTLVAASASTNPAKLKVAGGGSNICIHDGGAGTIYLNVNGTPSGDTGALTVDGASVVSTVDPNTKAPMPFGKNGYTFSKDGDFTIGLSNVAANTTVNVAVQAYLGTKTDGGTVKLAYTAATNCSPIKIIQR